jgi:hypothetical protein
MPDVKCSVSNCTYWGQENKCQADVIMIEVDQHANAKFNEEFAGETFSTDHQDSASKTANTCCHTFEAKKK